MAKQQSLYNEVFTYRLLAAGYWFLVGCNYRSVEYSLRKLLNPLFVILRYELTKYSQKQRLHFFIIFYRNNSGCKGVVKSIFYLLIQRKHHHQGYNII